MTSSFALSANEHMCTFAAVGFEDGKPVLESCPHCGEEAPPWPEPNVELEDELD